MIQRILEQPINYSKIKELDPGMLLDLVMKNKIENIYETASSKEKPAYKITVSPRKLDYKKRADKIIKDLLFYRIRLYKDGKRMPIGSLNLTIMFNAPK